MKKNLLLSTLLFSSILMVGSTKADASTLKSENKTITVTSKSAKLFKDTKLKSYSTTKQGTVYQVDGYKVINGKRYYRLYQINSKGSKTYKGYLKSSDAKNLAFTKENKKFIAKKNSTLWANLYYSQKEDVLKKEKVYFTKGYYKLGNGKKYYSIYQKNNKNKDKWCGYIHSGSLKQLKAKSYNKIVTLTRNYSSWNNLYFTQKKDSYNYTKGINYKAKEYYTINGKRFYSLYRTNSKGKNYWCGYMSSVALKELIAKQIPNNQKHMTVKKDAPTYKDFYFHKKNLVKKGTSVIAKERYTFGNNKTYFSIYQKNNTGKNGWLGYIDEQSLVKNTNSDNYSKATIKYNEFKKLYTQLQSTKTYFNTKDINKINDLYQSLEFEDRNIKNNIHSNNQNKINQLVNNFDNNIDKATNTINHLMISNNKIVELKELISSADQEIKKEVYTEESIKNLKTANKRATDFLAKNSHPTFTNINEFIQIKDNLKKSLDNLSFIEEYQSINNEVDKIIKIWKDNQDILKTLSDDSVIHQLTKLIDEKNKYADNYQSLLDYKQELINKLKALNISSNKWNYTETNDSIILSKYIGEELNIHIPGTFNNKKIIINTNGSVISRNPNITSITMDDVTLEGSLSNCFAGYIDLSTIKFNRVNTHKVTNMTHMFANLNNLSNLSGLENWDTSNVTDMSGMFLECYELSDLSGLKNWDTSNVTNMKDMFNECRNINDISVLKNWNTSNVTDMARMFRSCNSLSNLSGLENWDTSNVTDMSLTFAYSYLNDISALKNWNTSNVTNMFYMFADDKFKDVDALKNWNISKVKNLGGIFMSCDNLNNISALKNWDVSNVEDISGMFTSCKRLNDISSIMNWHSNIRHSTYDLGTMFGGTSVPQADIDQFIKNFNG